MARPVCCRRCWPGRSSHLHVAPIVHTAVSMVSGTNGGGINGKTSNNGTQSQLSSSIMNAFVVLLLCGVVGSALAEYPQRQLPYHVGANDHYSVEVIPSVSQEQSARLFWGNQGSNQVGGNGLWATLANKFPILNNMFGRMELANDYNLPQAPYHYNFQTYQQPTYQQPQVYQQPQSYQQPQNYYQPQPQYQYQRPQFYQQQIAPFRQRLTPFGRDVGFTDDAVIVTPPQVPIAPQPAPQPVPEPSPVPAGGYAYSKPQYRLDLPHK